MTRLVRFFYMLFVGFPDMLKRELSAVLFKHDIAHIGENPKLSFPIFSYGLENVSIGDNFECGQRLKIRTFSEWGKDKFQPKLIIGNNVHIESDCHISAVNGVEIGNDVLIASFVFISDHQHGRGDFTDIETPPLKRCLYSRGKIRIEDKVWIGEKVTILPGVTIGECSVVGAGSVVTKDIPPHCVAAGSPARIIRRLA